jgi:EamA domain-containing membrane protein RarD
MNIPPGSRVSGTLVLIPATLILAYETVKVLSINELKTLFTTKARSTRRKIIAFIQCIENLMFFVVSFLILYKKRILSQSLTFEKLYSGLPVLAGSDVPVFLRIKNKK